MRVSKKRKRKGEKVISSSEETDILTNTQPGVPWCHQTDTTSAAGIIRPSHRMVFGSVESGLASFVSFASLRTLK